VVKIIKKSEVDVLREKIGGNILNILKSLMVVAVVATVAVGATGAYFSDTATITDNTYTTGTLEIRVNGQPSVLGSTFSPTAPGQIYHSGDFHINNYGAPWFAGPSNLAAKALTVAVANNSGSAYLWDNLRVKVEVNRGWPTWQEAYNGKLKNLGVKDLLAPRWTELAPGESEMMRYEVWLPDAGDQSAYMGETLTWDFVVEGRTS